RMREVDDCRLRRIEGLRLFACELAILQRFLPDLSEREMGREVCHVRLDARSVETLKGLGNRAVQRLSFSGEKLCRNGLPSQSVPKRKLLGGLLDDELCCD